MMVLFVCTANIVRSYMAEGIFKEMTRRAQIKDVTVLSAGLIDMKGAQADPVAEKLLQENGFPLPGHRSRLLNLDMVEQADWILVMESGQKEMIVNMCPEAINRVHLLKSFSRDYDGVNEDIKDPYRKSILLYRLCFSEIYLATDGFMKCRILETPNHCLMEAIKDSL